jgi:hypothetical protein
MDSDLYVHSSPDARPKEVIDIIRNKANRTAVIFFVTVQHLQIANTENHPGSSGS